MPPEDLKLNVDNTEHPLSLSADSRVQDAIARMTQDNPAARANPPVRTLIFALEMLLRRQEERLRKQIAADLRNIYSRLGTSAATSAAIPAAVIPDVGDRARASELVEKLQHALDVLHDIGLDSTQVTILQDVIFPALTELKSLLQAEADTEVDAGEKRAHALSLLGSVLGHARTLAIVINAMGTADDAGENVKRAARAAEDVIDAQSKAQWIWELLLQLHHASPI